MMIKDHIIIQVYKKQNDFVHMVPQNEIFVSLVFSFTAL